MNYFLIFNIKHVNSINPIYAISVVLAIIVSLFVLTSCTPHSSFKHSPDYNIPKLFSDNYFRTIQQDITNTIKIITKTKSGHRQKNTQFSLIPAGPYISHNQPLDFPPLAIASSGNYIYVATKSSKQNHSNLMIVRFSDDGQSRIIGKRLLIKGEITKLTYHNKHLIFALKHGGIKVIDVSIPKASVTILNFPTKSPVQDIQNTNQASYVLLKDSFLLKIKLIPDATDASNSSFGKPLQQWKLPVSAKSFTIRNNLIFLAGPRGIATAKLTKSGVELIASYHSSGTPKDIQLKNSLALVADGPGGLIVFQIKANGHLKWLGSYNKQGAINSILSIPSKNQSENNNNVFVSLANGNILSIDLTNPELPSSGVAFKPPHPAVATTMLETTHSLSNKSEGVLVTNNSLLRFVMTGNNKQLISTEGVNLGGSRRGIIRDNILYVADWFSGLHLYDISNPEHIRHLSNYHTPGSSKGVVLLNDYALIGDDDQGLQIIDVKNPQLPRWVSELTPESLSGVGLAYTMKLVKNTLYLADHRGGFHIIDLSDINHPKRLGGYNTPGKSWGIDVVNHYIFVADDSSGLLVFDASNANKPKLVGQFNPGGQAEDVLIKNDLAYVTFFDKGLYILNINHPHKPKIIGHSPIPGNARGLKLDNLFPDKPLAYIAGWESGLHIVDVSHPETPHIIGSYDTDGAAWGVNIKDGVAYVLDWWGGIKAVDVRQKTKPVYLSQYHARSDLQQMRTKNKYLYAASGSSGLQVFDIKNPLNPIWVNGVDLIGNAVDVWLDEDRAYVATSGSGIAILDTLDPFYTRQIGLVNTPGQALRVRALNEILYIQDSLVGLLVVDVRDPQQPQEIARFPIKIQGLWIDDNTLWLSTTQGLVWWGHKNDGILTEKNMLAINGGSHWIRTQNDLVVTANKNGVVKLMRKASGGLTSLSQYNAQQTLLDLQLKQNTLYVLGKRSGLMAINISNPKSPILTTTYPATGKHTRFEIAQGAAFFAGEPRLASVTLLPSTALISNSAARTDGSNEINIHLPANLPIGHYHLLATSPDGQRELLPNAINVQLSAPQSIQNKGKSSLKTIRQMLKNPLKQPTEH